MLSMNNEYFTFILVLFVSQFSKFIRNIFESNTPQIVTNNNQTLPTTIFVHTVPSSEIELLSKKHSHLNPSNLKQLLILFLSSQYLFMTRSIYTQFIILFTITMQSTCVILEKSRADTLKKLLLKIKDTMTKKYITKTNIRISGISHKEFVFTISPLWPLFKQNQQPFIDGNSFLIAPSDLEIQDEASTTISNPNIDHCFLINLLGVKFQQLRVSEFLLNLNREITFPAWLSKVQKYIEALCISDAMDHNLKPDVLKSKQIFLVGKEYLSSSVLHSLFVQSAQQSSCSKYSKEYFMAHIYPSIVRGCQYLRWDNQKLKASFHKDWSQARRDQVIYKNKHLSFKNSSERITILQRFYYDTLKEIKRIKLKKQDSLFQIALINDENKNQTSLDLKFEDLPQFHKFYSKVKSSFRIYNLKIPSHLSFDLANGNIKKFIQTNFKCKIGKQTISVMPNYEDELKQFLSYTKPLPRKDQEEITVLLKQLHPHQLLKVLSNKKLSDKLTVHYSSEIKALSKSKLSIKFGNVNVYLECVKKLEGRRSSRNPELRIPQICENVFQEGIDIQEYVCCQSSIRQGEEPIIVYSPEYFQDLVQCHRYLNLIIKIIMKLQDGCSLKIVSKEQSVISSIMKILASSSSKCKTSKTAIQFRGTKQSIKIIEEQITSALIQKNKTFKNIVQEIANKKELQEERVIRQLQRIPLDIRGNRVIFKDNQSYQRLINYINIR